MPVEGAAGPPASGSLQKVDFCAAEAGESVNFSCKLLLDTESKFLQLWAVCRQALD